MTVLNELANAQGIRSDQPNIDLAIELVEREDGSAVTELVEALKGKDMKVRNDCIKALYEIGYRKPEMIAPYVDDFLKLIIDHNNRLVWGGMIALSTIADLRADEVYSQMSRVKQVYEAGSVITQDAGIRVFAKVAAHSTAYSQDIFPYLMEQLRACRPKSVAQYAESAQIAVDRSNMDQFMHVLEQRKADLSASQLKRVEKIERSL
jgi:hypothetical protein